MKMSIVIVSYKNYHDLDNCLKSIKQFNDLDSELEIIVVDNSPDNELLYKVKDEHSDIIVVKNTKNGFGIGNNIGYSYSNGDIICFLNPDTIIIKPIFKSIYCEFKKNTNLGLCGITLLNRKLKKNLSFYWLDKHSLFSGFFIKLYNKIGFFQSKRMFTSGSNLFFRRIAFENIGLFDENIFMYNEEKDLTRRLLINNWKTKYFSKYEMIHLEGGTTNSLFSFRERIKSSIYYCNKYKISFKNQYKSEMLNLRLKILLNKQSALHKVMKYELSQIYKKSSI